MPHEYGRAARMVVRRRYLGLEMDDMARILGVRRNSQQRWENGQDAIPTGIWDELDRLYDEFHKDIETVIAQAEADPDAEKVIVRVWRGRTAERPFPGWWQRVVSEAMLRDPRIEPVFPEELEDHGIRRDKRRTEDDRD